MRLLLSKALSKTCGHKPHAAHVIGIDVDGDGKPDRWRLCPGCWEHHGLHEVEVAKSVRLADLLSARVGGLLGLRKSHLPVGPDDRWITMHPHGADGPGHAVLLHLNRDGSHTVKGGAGGKLNGLRLTHVKDKAEYKDQAREKQKAKRDARQDRDRSAFAARVQQHKEALEGEAHASQREVLPDDVLREAHARARADKAAGEDARREALAGREREAREAERAKIALAAKAQGWEEKDYALDEEALEATREHLKQAHLDAHPEIGRALQSGVPVQRQAAEDDLEGRVEADLERLRDAHHRQVYARAQEVLRNHREAVLAAHDNLAGAAFGDVAVGDLVHDTLGDAGKGYQANLREQAKARGMDLDALEEEAQAAKEQADLERLGGDANAAARQKKAAQARVDAAQAARERIAAAQEKMKEAGLGEAGSALEPLKNLDTTPKAQGSAAHVEVLAQAKALDAQLAQAKAGAKALREADPLETLPKAAVVKATPLSGEDARRQVLEDLQEKGRQAAMGDLLDLYNAQDELSPLRSHLLSGHGALFAQVAHAALGQGLGVRALDPLAADILGPAGSAAVMRRALERLAPDAAAYEGLKAALAGEHIEGQVALAQAATSSAKALFDQADALSQSEAPLDTMDALLAGLDANQQRLELARRGREHLGLALGRLEAAAALNWALEPARPEPSVPVALGAISMEDALSQAYACGLSKADRHDAQGNLLEAGQFHLQSDGHNVILTVHEAGLDHLADSMREDPAHLERMAKVAAIKAGEHDEAGWLPEGFSRRPAIDVSREGYSAPPPLALQLDLGGATSVAEVAQVVRANIAQRFEHGQDPTAIVSDLRSESLQELQVPEPLRGAFREALETVMPSLKAAVGEDGKAKRLTTSERVDHKRLTDERLHACHAAWLQGEVKAGRLASEEASAHRQTLPQTEETRDLLHQVSIQDPRLQHAFKGLQDLGREGRRAVRDYAYEHVFGLDPKNAEEPITSLSPHERRAWEKWHEMEKDGNPYDAIQEHWAGESEGDGGGMFGGGMFGGDFAPEPHAFATVNLGDDHAVLEAARKHAQSLGYTPERRVTDLKAGQFEDVVPELEETPERPAAVVARDARKRIQGALRQHAFEKMMGVGELASSSFDPASVATAGGRWAQFVGDMGGEERAYRAMCDRMKGDFAQRFAKGYEQLAGRPWNVIHTPVAHSERYYLASLSPERRKAVEAQERSEQAHAMNRAGGKFAQGGVKDRLDAQREEAQRGPALFGGEVGKGEKQQSETHRVSLGPAAEAMVRGMLPTASLKKGTVAAGDIDMSTGDGAKQQRAIKQLEAVGRMGMTLGTGTGKTAIGLACHSHLKAQGKVKRSLFAVPSSVQENFGGEAARYYDVAKPDAPQWFADGSASTEARRASYHHESGHDICVVPHQSLRDDLTWALAQHRFAGDEDEARKYLKEAPEHERDEAIHAATDAQGWHFDMTITDEAHGLLNRQGKENSAMANAIDSFTRRQPYFASMSADPVKNDASEAFSFLRKVKPERFVPDGHPDTGKPGVVTQGEFARRFGTNTAAAASALQKEMEPYHYAESIAPDVAKVTQTRTLELTPAQQKDYAAVESAMRQARAARQRGEVDLEALQVLSPGSFEGKDASEHEAIGRKLSRSLGILKRSALNRAVNLHPEGAKMAELDKLMREHPPRDHPKIIFAHNLEAVDAIHDHLKAQGHRVVKITGAMSAAEKEARKQGFSPQWDAQAGRYVFEPTSDICVYSDAGCAGWNGQRADSVIHFDTPDTAMVHRQREGRSHRRGQRRDVRVHDLVTNTRFERTARKRLEEKDALRDALTTPAELIDDSGLGARIQSETETRRQRLVEQAARGAGA